MFRRSLHRHWSGIAQSPRIQSWRLVVQHGVDVSHHAAQIHPPCTDEHRRLADSAHRLDRRPEISETEIRLMASRLVTKIVMLMSGSAGQPRLGYPWP